MRTYEERKTSRLERLRARATAAAAEGTGRLAAADRVASVIPLGQPILVGHHSERRHRKDLERIRDNTTKGFKALDEAKRFEATASSIERGNFAISSDDSDAASLYREKLEKLEREVARFKEINVTIRTAQRAAAKEGKPFEPLAIGALGDLGVSVALATELVTPDFAGRIGIPPYRLSNTGAEIRRIKAKIAELEAKATATAPEPEEINGVRLVEEDNRVRLYFPGKPSEQVRSLLRSRGFLWSPNAGAWQRKANGHAWYAAREVTKSLEGGAS